MNFQRNYLLLYKWASNISLETKKEEEEEKDVLQDNTTLEPQVINYTKSDLQEFFHCFINPSNVTEFHPCRALQIKQATIKQVTYMHKLNISIITCWGR